MDIQSGDASKITFSTKLESLEFSVSKLITLCEKLSEENLSYKNNNKQLMLERSELQLKNDKVRGQVEAMVDRLKTSDNG